MNEAILPHSSSPPRRRRFLLRVVIEGLEQRRVDRHAASFDVLGFEVLPILALALGIGHACFCFSLNFTHGNLLFLILNLL